MINDFNISDIEKAIADEVRALGVSTHVWNNRPKATADDIDEFVVVKVTGTLTDWAAFGQCRVSVQLFARDIREMKNSVRLDVMQGALRSIPLWIDKYLIDGHPTYVGDVADDFGFHARIINFRITIKAT